MLAHPYADRFPMLGAEELDRLAADIAENGLNSPIVLDGEGRILDGRNRWAACDLAGVTPDTITFDGDDEAAFVLSVNVARRHMTTGQQAMSTALVLSDAGKRENGRWKRGSVVQDSELPGRAWQVAMNQAGAILDNAPELADDVVFGILALDAAFRQAEQARDAERQNLAEIERMQAEESDARNRLRELAPGYMEALDNGEYKSARQAYAAWEDENRVAAVKERHEQAAVKARRAAEQKNAEDNAKALGACLGTLEGLTYPEHREHNIAWWQAGSSVVPPRPRALLHPERLREFASALLAFADELEGTK